MHLGRRAKALFNGFSGLGRMRNGYAGLVCLGAVGLLGQAHAQSTSVRIKVVADARDPAPTDWRYTTADPGSTDWSGPGFDDAAWTLAPGGFGTGTVTNAHITTEWVPGQIWLRKAFTLSDVAVESVVLSLHHDEEVEVYLNGTMVYQETGWLSDYAEFYLPDEYRSALHPGANVLAVACRNTDGPGYVDAGLSVDVTLDATPLLSDARTFPMEWQYVTADPGTDWYQPEFDAAAWAGGRAGFGTGDLYQANTNTAWQESDIWMRATFKVDALFDQYQLSFLHDDDMEIYLNGTLVEREEAFSAGYVERMSPSIAKQVKVGVNTVAVHCHNNDGPGFVDLGLLGFAKPASTLLRRDGLSRRLFPGRALIVGSAGVGVAAPARGAAGRLDLFDIRGHLRATVAWPTTNPAGARAGEKRP